MGKDCLKETSVWHKPKEVPEEFLECYRAIEVQFEKLNAKNKFAPLIDSLDSVYLSSTYSHGYHTSRMPTCYSDKCKGMFDHVIWN